MFYICRVNKTIKVMKTTIESVNGGTIEVPTSFLVYCKSRGIKEITDDVVIGWITQENKLWNKIGTDKDFRNSLMNSTKVN